MSNLEIAKTWVPPTMRGDCPAKDFNRLWSSYKRWQGRTARLIERRSALRSANRRYRRKVGLGFRYA